MKKLLLILCSFLLANSLLMSQDLIVTNNGDSINCRITKTNTDFVYFIFKHNEEIRNTLIAKSEVQSLHYAFFPVSDLPHTYADKSNEYSRIRFAMQGGYSYLYARINKDVPDFLTDYLKELKSGYHLGADLSYFITEYTGLGIKFSSFYTSNMLQNIYIEDNYGNRTFGNLKDDININFFGPVYSTRLLNHNKSKSFILQTAIGYLSYKNNKEVVDKFQLTSGNIGLCLDIGYDIALTKKYGIGFQISALAGTLNHYYRHNGTSSEKIELETDEFESLHRIDVSVGFRFF